jgi:hypothetical protein
MRLNYNNLHKVRTYGQIVPEGVVIHYTVGKEDPQAPAWPSVENYLYWLNQRGYGYHRLVVQDIIYELASPYDLVAHAGPYNHYIGLSFGYLGPSFTAHEGWTAGPHSSGRTAWYPPWDRDQLQLGAYEVAKLLKHCVQDRILYHEDISSHNDPGPAFPRQWFENQVKRVGRVV